MLVYFTIAKNAIQSSIKEASQDNIIALCDGSIMKHFDISKLDSNDKERLKNDRNLSTNKSFQISRALLISHKSLQYSYKCLSHKKDYAILSLSNERQGVDLEIIKKRDFKPHINFCFNIFERKLLDSAFKPLNEFYRIWSIKEAILKYANLDFSKMAHVGLDEVGGFYLDSAFKKCYITHFSKIYDSLIFSIVTK